MHIATTKYYYCHLGSSQKTTGRSSARRNQGPEIQRKEQHTALQPRWERQAQCPSTMPPRRWRTLSAVISESAFFGHLSGWVLGFA